MSAMTTGGGLFGVAYRLLVELPKHAVGHLAVNEDHLEGAELLIIHIDGFVAAMLDRDGIAPLALDVGDDHRRRAIWRCLSPPCRTSETCCWSSCRQRRSPTAC